MAEIVYGNFTDVIRVQILSTGADYGSLLAPDQFPRVVDGLRRVMQNAAGRLVRAYKSGYPRIRDTISQVTRVSGFDWSVGVIVSGGFFPLVEFDTRPHMPPWGMPTKKHPEREWSRLAVWLQNQRGWATPYASAYPIARLIAQGRTIHPDGRVARRAGGVAGTFGRYILTDRFTLEIGRIEEEFEALLTAGVRGAL